MSNSIRIKRSTTAGTTPTALPYGELAVNIPDKLIFIGDAANTPVALNKYKGIKAHGSYKVAAGVINLVHAANLTATRTSAGVFEITVTGGDANDTILLSCSDNFSIAVTAGNSAIKFTVTTRNLGMLSNPIDDPGTFSIAVVGA